MIEKLHEALLSTQRALLGAVTPQLRGVVVDIDENDLLYIRFYHDGDLSEETLDLWQCAITETSAGLGPDCREDQNIERLDYPAQIPLRGCYAYLRKEEVVQKEVQQIQENFKLPFIQEESLFGNINRAMQNALLGAITPNIRSVALNWEDNFIYVHFYYEGEIKEEDKRNMQKVMNRFCKSFLMYYVYLRFFRIDKSCILPDHKSTVYTRYEKDYNNIPFQIPQK